MNDNYWSLMNKASDSMEMAMLSYKHKSIHLSAWKVKARHSIFLARILRISIKLYRGEYR